jgi:hypothetical protein
MLYGIYFIVVVDAGVSKSEAVNDCSSAKEKRDTYDYQDTIRYTAGKIPALAITVGAADSRACHVQARWR